MPIWTPEMEQELRLLIVAEYRRTRRRRYQSMCEGKYRFASPSLAHQTMRHRDMQAFKCKFCGSWHVAHMDRNRRLRGVDMKGKNRG